MCRTELETSIFWVCVEGQHTAECCVRWSSDFSVEGCDDDRRSEGRREARQGVNDLLGQKNDTHISN